MNWEESRALTPLKRDFLNAFFSSQQGFFLTGGSALGIFYLQHRLSYDLDLFTTAPLDWHVLGRVLADITAQLDAQLEAITETPHFRRYMLVRGGETEILDFVVESVPQIDPDKAQFPPVVVDTLREIAVNKLCALVGRTEDKDVVDLYFLAQAGFRVPDLIEAARQKEAGIEPAIIAWLLSQIDFHSVPDYVLAPVSVAELNAFVATLRDSLADMSFPDFPSPV